jgi:hypothetical protein
MNALDLDYETLDESSFEHIAEILLNKSVLVVNDNYYRIVEIEFYLKNEQHPDEYVHCDDDQLLYGTYYFHKFKNGTYKGGTFKGMDITLGDEDTSTYFGVLIRSLYDIANDMIIEGPCNVVNCILHKYECENLREFSGDENLNIFENDHEFVIKNNKKLSKETIYKNHRVGLSDKYPDYQYSHYRYLIFKNRIRKQKTGLEEI